MNPKVRERLKYSIFSDFFELVKRGRRKQKWHKLHPESNTVPMTTFDFDKVHVGEASYGELNVIDFGGECHLHIGSYVSIAQNVIFLLNAEHYVNHISTYPFRSKFLKETKSESFGKGDIIIEDDVWIGYGATILSGVKIGQGAIIAAKAVVTKNVPAYAIMAGSPARIIKFRFKETVIEKLLMIDYKKLRCDDIKKNVDDLYKLIESEDDIPEWLLQNM